MFQNHIIGCVVYGENEGKIVVPFDRPVSKNGIKYDCVKSGKNGVRLQTMFSGRTLVIFHKIAKV